LVSQRFCKGFARDWKVLQGIGRFCKGLEGFARDWKGLEGFARDWKVLQGIGRFCKGLEGGNGTVQEASGVAPGARIAPKTRVEFATPFASMLWRSCRNLCAVDSTATMSYTPCIKLSFQAVPTFRTRTCHQHASLASLTRPDNVGKRRRGSFLPEGTWRDRPPPRVPPTRRRRIQARLQCSVCREIV